MTLMMCKMCTLGSLHLDGGSVRFSDAMNSAVHMYNTALLYCITVLYTVHIEVK